MMAVLKIFLKNIYQNEFKAQFDEAGITYEHRLIDDMVASCIKMEWQFCMGL